MKGSYAQLFGQHSSKVPRRNAGIGRSFSATAETSFAPLRFVQIIDSNDLGPITRHDQQLRNSVATLYRIRFFAVINWNPRLSITPPYPGGRRD